MNRGDFQQTTHRKETTGTKFYDPGPVVANPECSVCKGFGVVHPRNLDGTPDYSRVIACTEPNCMADSARDYKGGETFARQSGVQSPTQTFDNFKLVPGTKKAFSYASELANGEAEFVWLLIYGGVGNGKTHLCNAIARESIKRGEMMMVNSADMFAQIKSAINDNTSEEVTRKFKNVLMLIIDDWGVEYGSEWEKEKFDEIMTSRYATARPTVVTTNKDLSELPERIKSRFQDKNIARTALNSAGDYRKR